MAIYPVRPDSLLNESDHLCPKCKNAAENSHMVQCENCQTILNFIPKMPNEDTVIFYVSKCSSCSGTAKDELQLTPNFFPESFI